MAINWARRKALVGIEKISIWGVLLLPGNTDLWVDLGRSLLALYGYSLPYVGYSGAFGNVEGCSDHIFFSLNGMSHTSVYVYDCLVKTPFASAVGHVQAVRLFPKCRIDDLGFV